MRRKEPSKRKDPKSLKSLLNLGVVAATLTLGACASSKPVAMRAVTAPEIYGTLPAGKRDAFATGYELGKADLLKSRFWSSGRNPRYPDGGMGEGNGTSDAEPKLNKKILPVFVKGGPQPDGTLTEDHWVAVESLN
jgi:hypothetical protein